MKPLVHWLAFVAFLLLHGSSAPTSKTLACSSHAEFELAECADDDLGIGGPPLQATNAPGAPGKGHQAWAEPESEDEEQEDDEARFGRDLAIDCTAWIRPSTHGNSGGLPGEGDRRQQARGPPGADRQLPA